MSDPKSSPETVVFLRGIGAGPDSWDHQIAGLLNGFVGYAPPLPTPSEPERAGSMLQAASDAVLTDLQDRGIDRMHLCGLSLGAVIATRFAIDHPQRVASLILSGSQVHPNAVLVRLQNAAIRVLPSRFMVPKGMSKETMLALLRGIATIDFRPELPKIGAPTLVLCGARDRPNLAAARELAGGIPGAELDIVPNASHEMNTQLPEEFLLGSTHSCWANASGIRSGRPNELWRSCLVEGTRSGVDLRGKRRRMSRLRGGRRSRFAKHSPPAGPATPW